ncbi:MAG: hypothetical protein NDI61_01160 [Bdellovibrionaceae bacterium]|nr:hypothetical protein [Pseudobdellovibrionaceae bacterium]
MSRQRNPQKGPRWTWAFLFSVLFFQVGCATYQGKVADARVLIGSGRSEKAIEVLTPLAQQESKDQLVYMLDLAIALQQAGRFQESAKTLTAAERIADVQDYTSLSKETASLLLNEEMVQYKGDDYEKVLINAINAINFLMLGNLESALVEVRRLNNKLHLYKTEAKRNYEQNPFAYYLGAIIWEADRKYDDAYIAYKKAFELVPNYTPLHEDLIRAAIKAQRPEEVERWQKQFPEVKIRPEWRDPKLGELVVVYQQGWGPRKRAHPQSPRVPKLYPVGSFTAQAKVVVEASTEKVAEKTVEKVAEKAVASPFADVATNSIYSVEEVAIQTLDDQYAALVGKRVAGVVAKAVVADQIRQKNALLGDLAWLALNITDRADLRQWSTLPESFQIARVYLKPGTYQVSLKGLSSSGAETGEDMEPRPVEIKPGRKQFLGWRSFR